MPRLYFIRHADAYDYETGMQLVDYSLNNNGRIQALQLAKRLKTNKFDAMYCSKIKRSIETCEIVNAEHKMNVVYTSGLNEVGNEFWPQPGYKTSPTIIKEYGEVTEKIFKTFNKLVKRHPNQEVIVFTHGNWIRVLLTKILADGNPEAFCHFVIHNTSLNIVDVDNGGYPHIISIADAAHTRLYDTHI
jgi:broad specificity phosphatase PhoE